MLIIYSLILLLLNITLYLYFTKKIKTKLLLSISLSCSLLLVILNAVFNIVPNHILYLAIAFSFAQLILKIMNSNIRVFEKSVVIDPFKRDKILKLKKITINIFFPAVVYFYQLLLLWNAGLQDRILQ